MIKDELKIYSEYLIELVRCAILNEMPMAVPAEIDLKKLFDFSYYHRLENIAYYSLKKLGLYENEKASLFEEYYNLSLLREATQQVNLEMITDEFEKAQIKHTVLKGSVIKHIYPSPEMRQSADIDILIDENKYIDARKIMERLGYHVDDEEKFGKSNDDGYEMGKLMRVELHRHIVYSQSPWINICMEIENNLRLCDGYQYRYEMSKEDYFIYLIIHMAKHMKRSGMGIKLVLDVWVYLKRYTDELDRAYMNKKFDECGLRIFEEKMRQLSYYWFDNAAIQDKLIMDLSSYIAYSGWIGTKKQEASESYLIYTNNGRNKKMWKFKYYMSVFFWPYKNMVIRYKFLKRYPVLLPVCWAHRAITGLLLKKDVKKELLDFHSEADLEMGRFINQLKHDLNI